MKPLCLLIGAGASFDCVMPGTPVRGQPNQKPPLTSELFNNQYDQWLSAFPKAGGLAAELRAKLTQSGVEGFLRIEADKKHNSARQKQLRQLPLYFRVLFNEVSRGYIRPEQTCYSALIQLINDLGFDKILVISLNYDTLFEQALERALDLSFSGMLDYFNPARAWKVLKPHGSVNWIKRLKDSEDVPHNSVEAYVSFIDGLEKLNFLDAEPILSSHPDKLLLDGKAIYPQITIPLEGKYDLLCPEEHVRLAKEFVAECGTFCVIGSSLKDDDVVNDIIKASLRKSVEALVAVTGDEGTGNEKFVEGARACFGRTPDRVHREGFSRFIQTGEAGRFLASIG